MLSSSSVSSAPTLSHGALGTGIQLPALDSFSLTQGMKLHQEGKEQNHGGVVTEEMSPRELWNQTVLPWPLGDTAEQRESQTPSPPLPGSTPTGSQTQLLQGCKNLNLIGQNACSIKLFLQKDSRLLGGPIGNQAQCCGLPRSHSRVLRRWKVFLCDRSCDTLSGLL